MPHSDQLANIKVVPLVHGKDKAGVNFGAEVYGVDLNNFSGKQVQQGLILDIENSKK